MKLYGRQFANRYIQKKLKPTSETRDAIIFEVDWDACVCKCRIQGSDEYVSAYFPRNEATIPSWMKPGNAVRLLHRAGVRGHMEVIGHGGAIPTPMPGSPSHPALPGLADGVISGGEMTAGGGMLVCIAAGTVRIDGVTYGFTGSETGYPVMSEASPEMTMDENYPPADMGDPSGTNYVTMDESDPPMTMSETFPPLTIGFGNTCFTLDPLVPDTIAQFRYDAFQIGVDGIIDYVKGAQSYGGPPLKPVISGGHVQLGQYILVVGTGGTTEITDGNIGWVWTEPHASTLEFNYAAEHQWNAANPQITVNVLNQYGYLFPGPRTYELNFIRGTGWLYSAESGEVKEGGTVVVNSSSGQAVFQYHRDQSLVPVINGVIVDCIACEVSPHFVLAATGFMEHYGTIQLITKYGWESSNYGAGEYSTDYLNDVQDSGGDVLVDWDEGKNHAIILEQDGDITFTGGRHGDKLVLLIRQDSSGGWVPTLPASVAYGDQITAVNLSISTAANSRTYLGFIYDQVSGKYDLVANVSGYV